MSEYTYVQGWSYSHDVELAVRGAMESAVEKLNLMNGGEAVNHSVVVTPQDYLINGSTTNLMPVNYVATVTILVKHPRLTMAVAMKMRQRDVAEKILAGDIGVRPPSPTTGTNPVPPTVGISLVSLDE